MFRKFEIPMAPRCDMKISLHLVSLQTAIHPTCRWTSLSQAGRLAEFLLLPPHLAQHMPDVGILLQLNLHLAQVLERMQIPLHIYPLHPVGRVAREHISGQNAIPTGVLNIDVEVTAGHGHHDVEIYLQVMRHSFFHAEQVRFMTTVPATKFGEREQEREKEEE